MNGLIKWFVRNPVASNLLMLIIIISGLLSLRGYDKEIMPSMPAKSVQIDVVYAGADPAEVEDRLCIRIEEAVADVEGVATLKSIATTGKCTVNAGLATNVDRQVVLSDIKAQVDAINTFPVDAERPIVELIKFESKPVQVAVLVDTDERTRKQIATKIRDELARLPGVDFAELVGAREYEVSIEISENMLRQYGLTFDDVANAVRGSSLNVPAGLIRAKGGDISLRTRSQAYTAADFEAITLIKNANGTNIALGDVATVTDGFEENPVLARFNNRPAILIDVKTVSNPDVVAANKAVRKYIENAYKTLPEGVELVSWLDLSKSFTSRVNILLKGGFGGLILVFLLLMMFLRPRIAFWVCAGMFTAFMGTLWVLPMVGISFNMISLFAFILVLGMVVDDAIIIGESIHSVREDGLVGLEAAEQGTIRVARPVLYAGMTTMVAFSPILFLDGTAAAVMKPLPWVVIITLVFSLIESYFILPAHLSHLKKIGPTSNPITRMQRAIAKALKRFIENVYAPFLDLTLRFKFMTFAVFIGFWVVMFSFVTGGWVRQDFFPNVPGDYIITDVTLTDGIAFERAEQVLAQVEEAALGLNAYYKNNGGEEPVVNVHTFASGNKVSATIDLIDTEKRKTEIRDISNRWREAIGTVADMKDFDVVYQSWNRDKPLKFVLAADTLATMEAAAKDLEVELAKFAGVFDITDTLRSAKQELIIDLKPEAETLGLNASDLARQVRQGFFGEEVQRIARGPDDVRVKIRYPAAARASLQSLQNMRVRTPDGAQVPFETVANIRFGQGATAIRRLNRRRVVEVTGNINAKKTNPREVTRTVTKEIIPALQEIYPDLEFLLEGDQKEIGKFISGLIIGLFTSLFGIYALIAIAFRSYSQPLLVMLAIPFGYIGAVIGHLVYGLPWSMFSFFGVVATAGVVVNDNLVLIDYINTLRERGEDVMSAVRKAAASRFRPILLTTLTTFFGLMPITFQKAPQAQYLIPMAVSLAFGVVMASVVTLVLIPAMYVWMDKLRGGARKKSRGTNDKVDASYAE